MINSPFFSIVIPSYNRAELIPETIDSILHQSFTDFEIIIVDDGSKDNTDEVIRKLYKNNPQVNYYKKINEERGRARNYGFEKSKGAYVVFFDSDDLMLPNYLLTLYDNIGDSQLNFIAAKYIITSANGEMTDIGNSKLPAKNYNYIDLLKGNFMACNFAVRRKNQNIILFEEDRNYAVLEDWIFLIQNLRNDYLTLIDCVCIHMLNHENRSMANNKLVIDRRLKANKLLIEKVNLNLEQKSILSGYSNYFCAIHSYLDNNKMGCIHFIIKAYKFLGINKKLLILFAKNLLGRELIQKIKL